MSFCTYIASDKPLPESDYLWPLSRGGEDIYTEKVYVAQIVPDLDDLSGVLSYIQNHMKAAEELELWHIWQGVESEPVIRTQTVPVDDGQQRTQQICRNIRLLFSRRRAYAHAGRDRT